MNINRADNFKKVFIHELGHFIANWIIFELINQYKPLSIVLKEKQNDEFWGKVSSKNRTDMNAKRYYPNAILFDFESTISTLYGCFFQSILEQKNSYTECLNCIDGSEDSKFFNASARWYKVEKTELDKILQEHYEILSNSDLTHLLTNFQIEGFLGREQFNYLFDELTSFEEIIIIKKTVKPLLVDVYEKLKNTSQK